MQPRQLTAAVRMGGRCKGCWITKETDGNVNLIWQIGVPSRQWRSALWTEPAAHAFGVAHTVAQCGRPGDVIRRKRGKRADGCAGQAATVGAMAIRHGLRGFRRDKLRLATITAAGCGACVRRQPGAPLSLRGCSDAAGFRYPFSVSGSKRDSPRTRLACADKPRRGQSRGT